jgi:hypothetical protein
VVTAEPVYANNRPEHYAVSAKFPQPQADTGAIAKTPRPLGPGLPDTPKASEVLLGAIGKHLEFIKPNSKIIKIGCVAIVSNERYWSCFVQNR